MYTVKQLSELADVTVRTLHYYDQIDLLQPSQVGTNGYRYYDDDALMRLQQILFYREIGLELMQIKDILDSPKFNLVEALRSHRTMLEQKVSRLSNLIHTIDSTISHLSGEFEMNKKHLFSAFSEEKQKEYEREARLQWGPENVNPSIQKWNNYTETQKESIMQEGGEVYLDMVKAMIAGKTAQSAEVQDILARWHNHIRHFYEPTLDILRGLGQMYNTHPEFMAFFQKIHPDLPAYLEETITQYVDDLEYAEIERMLAADEEQRATR